MYIPRPLLSSAYAHLKAHAHSTNPSILLLCALDTDSLCAARVLTHLLKRDYIPHKIHPVAGYQELENVNNTLVRGNEELRFVICLGLGGMVDLSNHLDLGSAEDGRNVECWIVDGRRPWNLFNVFAGHGQAEGGIVVGGKVAGGRHGVGVGVGGIKCFDDGDIEEDMAEELVAFQALTEMPEVDSDSDSEDDDDGQISEDEDEHGGVAIDVGQSPAVSGRKRKSSDEPGEDSEGETDEERTRARRRRRTGSNESSRESSPLIQRHTLLSHPSSRALASSPPPALSHSPASSPSQQLPLLPQRPPPTDKYLRRKLRRLKAKHGTTVRGYYAQGTWYGEPISGLMYSLASDLGREDNDLLWLAIIGVSSGEIIGRGITSGPPRKVGGLGWVSTSREDQIRGVLRDEVRRLNPPEALPNGSMVTANSSLQTTARSPSDTAIRLSPEYRFMLIRHWSLYDSMLHSSFLGTKLHIWSENGRKRLHKLLAKMGFSLSQCKQSYTHMDMDLKRSLRERLEKYAPLYGLEGIVREGFVRCWGFRGCLSAADVAYIIGGLLEMGKKGGSAKSGEAEAVDGEIDGRKEEARESENWIGNFWAAYDALEDIESLKSALPIAMDLTRAILRTGTALIEKRQIRLLRAFRLAVVKEGPDVATFTHPNALSKLALWLAEAILEQEREHRRKKHLPLVVACLNERKGVYVVVGTALGSRMTPPKKKKSDEGKKKENGRGKEKEKKKGKGNGKAGEEEDEEEEEEEDKEKDDDSDDDSDNDEDSENGRSGRNKFALAFQEVANSTNARIRIDAFEATVVEVRKEDLAGFLEGLSLRNVIG